MMVSTATAVLPVWRSPMMSSRCPRPIGTMASIAFRPVCTGCETDFLAITPGATFSMTSLALAAIGPLPSMGAPSAFTTRPSNSGPTGTSRMRPVHFTVSPSVMCWYSPRITEPTESRSRLSARPKVLFGNSSISPCITSESPWMRQVPSVTVTTVPWVRTSAPSERFSILLRIRSLISDGLSCCILAPSLAFQRRRHVFELAAHRAVDDFVADGDVHAADQLAIERDARLHAALEAPGYVRDQARDLRIVERKGAADLGLEHAFALVLQRRELRVDLGKQCEAPIGDQQAHEIARLGREIPLGQRDDQVVERVLAEVGVGDARLHVGVARDVRQGGEDFEPVSRGAGLVGEAEHGLGVGPGDGRGFGHRGQISRFSWASSWAWVLASTSRRRIFAAPATASAATCSRSASLARATCWSMSALAAARMRSASARAAALASSSICASRFSAEEMISPTRPRAFASSSPARLPAASSSCLPRSPAASPSAIVFWRSSMARVSGGQMNLTQKQMNSAKAMPCAIRVRFRFIRPARRASDWLTRRTCPCPAR